MLIDKNMYKKDLAAELNISSATMAKMGKGETVSLEVLQKICEYLDCNIGDIMSFEKECKEGNDSNKDGSEAELDKWLTTIKEILDDPQPDAIDFLDTIKLNLFASEIFVFTPKGELRTMPAGSTTLDFAFTIHTFVGSHCIGAKVNHKLVPISHKL